MATPYFSTHSLPPSGCDTRAGKGSDALGKPDTPAGVETKMVLWSGGSFKRTTRGKKVEDREAEIQRDAFQEA